MTVSIIVSFATTLLIYVLAMNFNYGGEPLRMSGNIVYDIFMGASLNPRLFTSKIFALGRKNWQGVDLKMFAEVRVPWVLLFTIAISGGVKQYEDYGYVTGVSEARRRTLSDEADVGDDAEHVAYDPRNWSLHQRLVSPVPLYVVNSSRLTTMTGE